MSRASAQHMSTSPAPRNDDSPPAAGRIRRLGRLRAAVLVAWGDALAVAGAAAALLPLLARPPAPRAPPAVAGQAPREQGDDGALPEEADACASES